jgi:hypothetical protein
MLVNTLGIIVIAGGFGFASGKPFFVLPGGTAAESGKFFPVVAGPVSFE